jgi:ureidoacrylate peracid hydrolase
MSELLTTLEDVAAPKHTALVVIDMQNDFCEQGGYIDRAVKADISGCPAVADRINIAVDAARASGVKIVWVRANYQPELVPASMLARNIQRGTDQAVCCAGGTWGYDFYRVKPRQGEFFVEKHCYDAFHGTNLDDILKNQGIRSLVYTGVVTNVCVESTLRSGCFHGYYAVVPEDCVGGPFKDLHDATLKNVRMYYGHVTDSSALAALWTGAARQPLRKAG